MAYIYQQIVCKYVGNCKYIIVIEAKEDDESHDQTGWYSSYQKKYQAFTRIYTDKGIHDFAICEANTLLEVLILIKKTVTKEYVDSKQTDKILRFHPKGL